MITFNSAIDLNPTPIKASHLLAGLVSVDCAAYETHSLDTPYPLMAEEAKYVSASAKNRLREFSAGRACARAALLQLGIQGFPILKGVCREPIWPAAFAGSITHTRDYAGALVVSKAVARSVGIDAEYDGSVKKELWHEICTPPELEWLGSLAIDTAYTAASIIFSAKEAFYKAQFPLTGKWLDFQDVRISVDNCGFRASTCRHVRLGVSATDWEGRYRVTNGLVLTAICMT